MKNDKKQYLPEIKVKAVLDSLQHDTTIEAVRRKYYLPHSVLHRWRKEFKENVVKVFEPKRNSKNKMNASYKHGESPEELKRIIGELTVQNEILKKTQILLS